MKATRTTVLPIALLIVSVVAVVSTVVSVHDTQRGRFNAQTQRMDAALADRVTTYVQVLRGGAGLFRASDDVTRLDWVNYVDSLRLDARYPGFKSLTYAPAVRTRELGAFQQRVRNERLVGSLRPRDALRGYTIRPPDGASGRPAVHAPILYVAPFTAVNRAVLGVDMMREPQRRATMQLAARSGEAATSPMLHLSGSANKEAGFIVYVPISRQGQLRGWLTAAFLAESFIAGVQVARATTIDFEVSDGEGNLLFSTAGVRRDGAPRPLGAAAADGAFSTSHTIDLPQSHWKVHYAAPSDFVPASARAWPWIVGGAGLLVTLAVWLMAAGADRSRRQARQLAEQAVVLREAREEAEVATRAKSVFLATMSHELRSPLHALLAASAALERQPDGEEGERNTRVLQTSGEHLLHVINGVLDWSKVEDGEIELEHIPVDVGDALRVVADLVRDRAVARGVDVRVEDPAGVGWVACDPTRLRQVLLNLATNAVTHTDTGEVVLSAELVADRLTFAVRDTGVGIPADRLARAFEPFAQADPSATRTRGGTGLGLPIAAQLVRAMGGQLRAVSEPGKGSTFTFDLPLERIPTPVVVAAPDDAYADADLPVLRLLVAEDESVNQIIALAMLKSLGQHPRLVGDGAEALAALEEGDFDLVLLDLSMPVMGGLEAARTITSRPGRRPRLVAMTASVSSADRAAALDAGFDDLVPKPYTLATLAGVLRASAPAGR